MFSADDFLFGQRGWNALTLKAGQRSSLATTPRSFYYGTRFIVPTLTPVPAGLGDVSRVQTC